MNLITTTELRTKVSEVVRRLAIGDDFTLIHRSRIVGKIIPDGKIERKVVDAKRLATTLKKFEPKKKMSYKQIMKIYDHYMMYRHGPRVS